MTDDRKEDSRETSGAGGSADAPEAEPSQASAAPAPETETQATDLDFPIVGIGASAGGLGAFEAFFTHMPAAGGIAFVLVQHLHAPHKSLLVDLLRRYTAMEVSQVEDGVRLEPDHVYIIPPGQDLALLHGSLHLMAPAEERGPHLAIDHFFRTLAQDQGERAICVILSGTGSDGTLGLQAVKEAGGMAMVQDPEDAEYDGMPRSAISTGQADFILAAEEMPQQLLKYLDHQRNIKTQAPRPMDPTNAVQKILIVLRDRVGHDFSFYKQSTLARRIERRMAVNRIADIETYTRRIQRDPQEADHLFRKLLISVTSFFRDPEAFAALETHVITGLLEGNGQNPIRVWVPGCATGEEAFSIAILLREALTASGASRDVRIFATDIDEPAIQVARAARYPEGIAADVSPKRLNSHFIKENGTYRVTATIREMVTFAKQDVIADPPFSGLDLISCRNLLIYLSSRLQDEVIPIFHFALRPERYLFLGTSESADKYSDLFAPVDKRNKIYRREPTDRAYSMPITIPLTIRSGDNAGRPGIHTTQRRETDVVQDLVEETLLSHYAPACAVVDDSGRVHYFHGRTGNYLEPAPGQATLDIEEMAREGLRISLSTALHRARSGEDLVHYRDIAVKTNGDTTAIDLTVRRIEVPADSPPLWLVAFEEVPVADSVTEGGLENGGRDRRVVELEQKLEAAEKRLQATVEQLQSTNEELKSSNEELQSSNEELQSTNEELETSKEELQSMNEELITANAELKATNEELNIANNDMQNLLAGTGIATIFLDEGLNIRRFTPAAGKVINIIESDVGRPLGDLASKLIGYEELFGAAREVLDTLVPQSHELRSRDGEVYRLRVQPYRTRQNIIEGVVLTFVDISELVAARREAEAARDYARNIVDTVREPILVLSGDLHIVSANRAFYQTFQAEPAATEGHLLYRLGDGQWNITELRDLLEEILPERTVFNDYPVTYHLSDGSESRMILNARELSQGPGKERRILLAIEEPTRAVQDNHPERDNEEKERT